MLNTILDYGKIIIPLLLPVPGLVAFYWTWKDRRYKRASENPYGTWKINNKPTENGWYHSRFDIKNRWDEPLYAHKVSLKGRRRETLCFHRSIPTSTDLTDAPSSLNVTWEFLSSTRTGDKPSSGGTELYIKLPRWSGDRKTRLGQLIQKFPRLSKRSQSATQHGYSVEKSNANELDAASLSNLYLEVSLRSASNRELRCIIPATLLKERPKATPTTIASPMGIKQSVWK